MASIFDQFPQLKTLLGKVPEEIIQEEVSNTIDEFSIYQPAAQKAIPISRLCDVFPGDLELGRITLENFLGQWGNISIEELCKICLIAKWRNPHNMFEFGTYNGLTTLQLAMNTSDDCQIYTLDVNPEIGSTLEIGKIDQYLAKKQGAFNFEVGSYFIRSTHQSKIFQLWGDSTKIDLSMYYGKMDLVFIDAGHTYEYVKSDTNQAFNMLRKGGVIIWHDYMQVLHPGVTRCLYEYARDGRKIHHLKGTNLAVHYED